MKSGGKDAREKQKIRIIKSENTNRYVIYLPIISYEIH